LWTFRICGSFGVQKWRTDPHSGPKLCYLFQAGIPEIGLLGTFGPQNWPNRLGFDLWERSKFAPPEGKSVSGPQILASQRQKSGSWVSDLGSQTLELASQRSNLASQRSKMTSRRPKIGLPDPKIYPIFLILRMSKIAQYFDYIDLRPP